MNIPVGIAASVMVIVFVKEYRHALKIPVDWIGIFLLILTVGCLQIFLEKGNGEDWFSTTYIAVLAFVVLIAGILFVWRELSTGSSRCEFQDIAASKFCFGHHYIIFIWFRTSDFLLRASYLLPESSRLQRAANRYDDHVWRHCNDHTAALCRHGIKTRSTGAAYLFIRHDTFLLFTQMLSGFTLSSGLDNFLFPIVVRGIGLSLLFVPITTFALQDVPPEEMGQATGLNNMMRQLGGSLGIAIITTIISSRFALHRSHLAEFISPYSPHFNERFNIAVKGLDSKRIWFCRSEAISIAIYEWLYLKANISTYLY